MAIDNLHGADGATCFHCGECVADDCHLSVAYNGKQHPVCCAGCAAVFQLITRTGLDRYYRFRQELGRKVTGDMAARRLAWQAVDGRESLWGAAAAAGRRELLLQVEGIRCAACAWLIRSQLEASPGIHAVQVDTATGFTRINWDPAVSRLSTIAMSLFDLGYAPHLPIASAEELGRRHERRASLKRLGVAGLGMMQAMMYAVGLYAGEAMGISPAARGFLSWVSLLVTLPVLMYSGRVFFTGAWRGLKAGQPGMDVPVALAIGLAFIVSCINFFRGHGEIWFDSVVMFIFFLTLGRHIELSLRHRSLQAGTALARLMPEWAQRITAAGVETVPASDVVTGELVRVAPGETFPADGVISSGTTEVDEALLTGESQAVMRGAGESVVAGTVNLSQAVEVKVTASGNESTISALARLVLSAQTRRSSTAGLPSWLVPAFILAVLTLATATWFFWHQVQPGQAFAAALAVLVASCPCALSLALPAVYSAASHRLMMEGILLTRSDALHDLLRVDTVIFDKTGTLTRGYPEIRQVQTNPLRPECTDSVALEIAAALEAHSIHPVARAFRHGGSRVQASAVTAYPAGGLEGMIDGHRWCIGNARFIHERLGLEMDQSGHGGIWLADEHGWSARFALADALRAGSKVTLQGLSASGLDVRILSGDAEAVVAGVAASLGVSRWYAQQRADMKLQFIRDLQTEGRTILMVGDGANDGPVLAAADVSMTVQGATELANSSADFILTAESLQLVMRAFDISRHAARLIRQNLVWALVYNAAVLPLAMSGALKPWMAALGMSASSLLVVLNATRLSRLSKRRKLTATTSTMEMQLQ